MYADVQHRYVMPRYALSHSYLKLADRSRRLSFEGV